MKEFECKRVVGSILFRGYELSLSPCTFNKYRFEVLPPIIQNFHSKFKNLPLQTNCHTYGNTKRQINTDNTAFIHVETLIHIILMIQYNYLFIRAQHRPHPKRVNLRQIDNRN